MNPLTRPPSSNSISPPQSKEELFPCDISVKEEDGIYKFDFDRAKYLSSQGLPENTLLSLDSQPVQILTKLFRKFRFLPLIWTPDQAQRALIPESAVGPLLRRYIVYVSNFTYSFYVSSITAQGENKVIDCQGFLGPRYPSLSLSSLITRLFFNSFGNSTDLYISQIKSLYQENQSEILAGYVQGLLNSNMCIRYKRMNSHVWRRILDVKSDHLEDENAIARIDLAHAVLKKKSYDVIIFQEDINSALLGVYLWTKRNIDVQLNLFLMGTDERVSNLAKFMVQQFNCANLSLKKINGSKIEIKSWIQAMRYSKSAARFILNIKQSWIAFFRNEILTFHPLYHIALYMKCTNVPSLMFLRISKDEYENLPPRKWFGLLAIIGLNSSNTAFLETTCSGLFCDVYSITSNIELTKVQFFSLFPPYPHSPCTLPGCPEAQNHTEADLQPYGPEYFSGFAKVVGEEKVLTGEKKVVGDKATSARDEVRPNKRPRCVESSRPDEMKPLENTAHALAPPDTLKPHEQSHRSSPVVPAGEPAGAPPPANLDDGFLNSEASIGNIKQCQFLEAEFADYLNIER